MRIVIIGGNGFIGSNLLHRLVRAGYDTVCCDKFETFAQIEGVCYKTISSCEQYEDIIEKNDVIFYLQWNGMPSTSVDEVAETLKNNIVYTINFLEICAKKQIKRFIFSSSGGTVYGIPTSIPISEEHRLAPVSPYGIQKVAAEHYINLLGRERNIDTMILRISNPYGPGQAPFRGQGVIPTYLACALTGKKFNRRGDGSGLRDYIYIDDLIEILMKLIDYSGRARVFNIGSGTGCSLNELIAVMDHVLVSKGKKPAEIIFADRPISDVSDNILDCSLIKQETGWQAHTDISKGVEQTLLYLTDESMVNEVHL